MRLSEDRISHIAHLIIDAIWRDDLVDYPKEDAALQEVKKTIMDYLKIEDEVDEFVRGKIRSMSMVIPEGGREWDVLYKKFFNEEMAKKGFK